MSQRAFSARLILTSDEERAALWRTHRIFNERLRWVLRWIHKMKRGESDPRYAEIFKAIRNSQNASEKLEAVTSLKWSPQKGLRSDWQKLAADLIKEGKLLFDRERDLPGLSKEFRRKLFESALQMIHGHRELTAIWIKAHEEWKEERIKWEKDNSEYMTIRPLLEAFEKEHGQAAKRRERWHKWLAFLQSDPKLAAWRGGPPIINQLDIQARKKIENARPYKRNKIEMQELFKINPELKALSDKHGFYQREFVRPWAKKRNADGFKHRPTFTEPSPDKHPFWFQFKKGETYKNLDLKECTLQLQLLASADEKSKKCFKWFKFRFRPDSRLRLLKKSPHPEQTGKGKNKFTYMFSDPALGLDRPAEIRGAKLIFRPRRPDGDIYLSFACDLPDLPSRLKIKQESCDKSTWLLNKIRKELHAQDPVTCAFDLGIRRLAAGTVRRNGKIIRAKIIREDDQPAKGPKLPKIKNHKNALAAGRSKRGKPVKGEESFIDLQNHITKMGEDRFKRGARRMVNFARENNSDVIIMEKFAGLIPDAEKERGINKALMDWNRGHLVKWIKQLANDAGIRVIQVSPNWTSQLCSRCGSMGARFSADHGQPVFELVAKLFACPNCGYMANADHNASVNLHRKFFGELPEVKKISKGLYRVIKSGQKPVEVNIEDLKNGLFSKAAAMCRGEALPF